MKSCCLSVGMQVNELFLKKIVEGKPKKYPRGQYYVGCKQKLNTQNLSSRIYIHFFVKNMNNKAKKKISSGK